MSIVQTMMGIVDTGRISVPTVVESLLRTLPPDASERRLDWWSRKLLHDAGVSIDVSGREHAGEPGEPSENAEPFVVMSNHQSLYDIPVLFQSGLGRIRMVTKAELFRVPVWGRAMEAAGFIRIDRRDREQAVGALRDRGGSLLAAGTRVWIAPEGTRSRTGLLGPFKSGGFRMALELGVRILPVAIEGTRAVLPAEGFVVQTGKHVKVTLLPPIDPAAYGVDRRRELMADVRRAIATALGQPAEE
jgi:1-acyl-sn-glycerol-3-phosphate acyltransferase